MRAEQVRKWNEAEEKLAREGGPQRRKGHRKGVRWLTGQDGNTWVWVMGDHANDRSIEEILEEEARQEAHQRALHELSSDIDRKNTALRDMYTQQEEDALKAQLGSLRVGPNITDSMYDDADGLLDHTHPLLFQPPSRYGINNRPSPALTPNRFPTASTSSAVSDGPTSSIGVTVTNNGHSNNPPMQVTSTKVSSFSIPTPQKAEVLTAPQRTPASALQTGNYSGNQTNGAPGGRPPIAPKPTSLATTSNWQKNGVPEANDVKLRTSRFGLKSPEEKAQEIQKRESEIFQSLLEDRERRKREAEQEEERIRKEWEEQEKKAREAEAAMREMAQKAREQHRQLIRTSTSILPALKDTKATSLREAIKNLPRPPKPKSRAAIIEWFKRDELPRGTGFDPISKAVAPWFHGIISRDQAENLLQDKPTGSFLVRVSERIWGYTVSYVVGDGTYKHFLIEKIPEGYQFLGTNQVVHDQLYDLVQYHESAPITAKGNEILKWSVGQATRPADYSDLIPEQIAQPYGNMRFRGL
ncbi:hypothetical protein WR25_18095 [Diploscapter pachys]|uniref:SH2 domain-containing protein n=1 Tax=Diploscapter pachys TaxID=2018661 RepID=A0A2A2LTU5_9BILA|nr:hypothetical protein WR25_18095 [Diploscapter pachys]